MAIDPAAAALIVVRTLVAERSDVAMRDAPALDNDDDRMHRYALGMTIDAGADANSLFAPDTFVLLQRIADAMCDHASVIYNATASLEPDGRTILFGWRTPDAAFVE